MLSNIRIDTSDPQVYAPVETTRLLAAAGARLAFPNSSVLELGTGSGMVGIAVAQAAPTARVTVSDINPAAIQCTLKNIFDNQVNVKAVKSDWFKEFQGETFDLILAHPPAIPYLPGSGWGMTEGMALATNGGEDGSESTKWLMTEGRAYLSPGGKMVLAIPHWSNFSAVMDTAEQIYSNVEILARGEVGFFPFQIGNPPREMLEHLHRLVSAGTIEMDFTRFPPVSPVSIVSLSGPA